MGPYRECHCAEHANGRSRRAVLKSALALAAIGGLGLGAPGASRAASLTKDERDRLTPDQIIDLMRQGNERFRTGRMLPHDYLEQRQAAAAAQYPVAAILGCIDSRAPAEIVLDAEIGDLFNARVAGNVANDDVIGSLEFACALAGAKVVLVMGHTACGAVKGAIDGAALGALTGLLDKIKPAVAATQFDGDRSGKNGDFVDAVARTNVLLAIDEMRKRSDVLTGLETSGKLKIAGAMYDLASGRVDFLA